MDASIKDRQHGLVQTYWAGCRCAECREGNRLYCKAYAATPHGKAAVTRTGVKWRSSERGKTDQRRRDLKRRFDITPDDYDQLLCEQGGVCAICKKTCSTGIRLAVDHNHTTGKVRGLLCTGCNTGLGKFKDSVELLTSAIAYLK